MVEKRNFIWEYSKYNAVVDKSTGQVNNNGVICDRLISGMNLTNLKMHLKSNHPAKFDDCELKEKQRKVIEPASKPSNSASRTTRSPCTTSTDDLPALLSRRPTLWPHESKEAVLRDDDLLNMIITCNLPSRIIESEAIVKFCSTMDSKYKIPGKEQIYLLLANK